MAERVQDRVETERNLQLVSSEESDLGTASDAKVQVRQVCFGEPLGGKLEILVEHAQTCHLEHVQGKWLGS